MNKHSGEAGYPNMPQVTETKVQELREMGYERMGGDGEDGEWK